MPYRLDTPFGEFLVRDRELAEKLHRLLQADPGERRQIIRCSAWRPAANAAPSDAFPQDQTAAILPCDRRRWLRRPAGGVLILLETLEEQAGSWVCAALDLNQESLGLDLPPPLEPGSEVLLTFALDEAATFHRLPSVVQRRGRGSGAVRFRWPTPTDRKRLAGFLGRAPAPS